MKIRLLNGGGFEGMRYFDFSQSLLATVDSDDKGAWVTGITLVDSGASAETFEYDDYEYYFLPYEFEIVGEEE